MVLKPPCMKGSLILIDFAIAMPAPFVPKL
jgi:hypothetical protein